MGCFEKLFEMFLLRVMLEGVDGGEPPSPGKQNLHFLIGVFIYSRGNNNSLPVVLIRKPYHGPTETIITQQNIMYRRVGPDTRIINRSLVSIQMSPVVSSVTMFAVSKV